DPHPALSQRERVIYPFANSFTPCASREIPHAPDDTFEPFPKSLPGVKNVVYPSYGGTAVRLAQPQIRWLHRTSNVTIRQVLPSVPAAISKPDLQEWTNHYM